MSSGKIRKLRSILTANGGCGCGSDSIIEPKPVSKISFSDQNPSRGPSSSDSFSGGQGGGGRKSSDEDLSSTTTFSLTIDNTTISPHYCPENKHEDDHTKCPKIQNSIAVVKDSDDPYRDFRRSMLQMIFEKEIYTRDDLQELLDCFLQLNSPRYHKVIVRAFMEIWNGGFPASAD